MAHRSTESRVSFKISSREGRVYANAELNADGFDYAEYFYNSDGFIHQDGQILTFNGAGVAVPENENDYIAGVVSTVPGVVCNASKEGNEHEHTLVGLLGQLYVRVYENISTDYVSVLGKSSKEKTRLRMMTTVTPYNDVKGYGVVLCMLK